MSTASPQPPPGKHYDPQKGSMERNVFPRMGRGRGEGLHSSCEASPQPPPGKHFDPHNRSAVPRMKRGLRQASPERGVLRRWEWRKAAQSSFLKSRNPTRKRFGSSHASLKGGPQRGRRGLKTQTSAASMYGGQWSSIEPETVNRTAPKPLWGICLSFSTTENLEALIYGRQIRVASAAASACRLSLLGSADRKQRGCRLSLPPMNGEVPAKQAEGFVNAEFGNSNL